MIIIITHSYVKKISFNHIFFVELPGHYMISFKDTRLYTFDTTQSFDSRWRYHDRMIIGPTSTFTIKVHTTNTTLSTIPVSRCVQSIQFNVIKFCQWFETRWRFLRFPSQIKPLFACLLFNARCRFCMHIQHKIYTTQQIQILASYMYVIQGIVWSELRSWYR